MSHQQLQAIAVQVQQLQQQQGDPHVNNNNMKDWSNENLLEYVHSTLVRLVTPLDSKKRKSGEQQEQKRAKTKMPMSPPTPKPRAGLPFENASPTVSPQVPKVLLVQNPDNREHINQLFESLEQDLRLYKENQVSILKIHEQRFEFMRGINGDVNNRLNGMNALEQEFINSFNLEQKEFIVKRIKLLQSREKFIQSALEKCKERIAQLNQPH